MSPASGTAGLGALLVSLQLSDSAFPSGLYTMSHGLEGFHQAGLVVDHDDVDGLLEELLTWSVGPGDATALALSHAAVDADDPDAIERVDRLLFASKLNAEMRNASVRSGRQLVAIAAEVYGAEPIVAHARRVKGREVPGCQPVVSGVCYAATGVDRASAVASDLFAFAASFVGAALRLRLVDHRQAQVVLHRAGPTIERATADALDREIEDLGGCAPMADISSAGHERANGRLFAS